MLIGPDGQWSPVAVLTLLWKVGLFGATAGVLLVLIRKAPPLTTQHNQMTGMTEHGILTWGACFYGTFVGLPWLIVVVAEHPLLLVPVAVVLIGGIYRLVTKHTRKFAVVQPEQAVQEQPPIQAPTATRYLTPFPTSQPADEFWQRPANGTPIL